LRSEAQFAVTNCAHPRLGGQDGLKEGKPRLDRDGSDPCCFLFVDPRLDHRRAQAAELIVTLQPARAEATLDALGPAVVRTLAQLDDLGRGIYPRALTAGGVAEALSELAAATSLSMTVLRPEPEVRWPSDVEAAVYFTCAEALQNATKHGRAGRIEIRLDATTDAVFFLVHDDGAGFDPTWDGRGTGMRGMRDRGRG
jgi:signal transduction histidine kinase